DTTIARRFNMIAYDPIRVHSLNPWHPCPKIPPWPQPSYANLMIAYDPIRVHSLIRVIRGPLSSVSHYHPWPKNGTLIAFYPWMPSTKRHIKVRVILFSALAVVCAAVAAGLWYWRANKDSIIRSSIEKAVDKKSAGLYKVEYADLHLDEL